MLRPNLNTGWRSRIASTMRLNGSLFTFMQGRNMEVSNGLCKQGSLKGHAAYASYQMCHVLAGMQWLDLSRVSSVGAKVFQWYRGDSEEGRAAQVRQEMRGKLVDCKREVKTKLSTNYSYYQIHQILIVEVTQLIVNNTNSMNHMEGDGTCFKALHHSTRVWNRHHCTSWRTG